MNKKIIIIKYGILTALLTLTLGGCAFNLGMTGTVLDAETEEPVEGAVARVEWKTGSGCVPGMSATKHYKEAEAVTDKDGRFTLPGALNPFVRDPNIVIYKKGYVAWREYATFPDYNYERRETFKWGPSRVFLLDRFVRGAYSHSAHTSYIESGLKFYSNSKLGQAYEWELTMSRKESDLFRKKWHSPTRGNKKEKQIKEEVLQELYLQNKEKGKLNE